jgi:hypothetical protein
LTLIAMTIGRWEFVYTHQMRRISTQVLGAVLGVLLLAAPALPAAKLQRLRGMEELKTWFNAGKGHPRLILLVSPT